MAVHLLLLRLLQIDIAFYEWSTNVFEENFNKYKDFKTTTMS